MNQLRLNARQIRFALFVIFVLVVVVILFRLAPVIVPVLEIFTIVSLIVLALEWPVQWQVAHRIPRWAAAINMLILFLLVVGLLIFYLVPPLVTQFEQFIAALPALWVTAVDRWGALAHRFPQLGLTVNPSTYLSGMLKEAGGWLQAARTVFATAAGAFTAVVLIIVTTLYTLLNPFPLLYGIRGLFPTAWWKTIDIIAADIAYHIRGWVVGTALLSLLIGVLDYLGLLLINAIYHYQLPFIFLFAILGGLLEVIPIVGPIISAVLPALVGFSIDPLLGLLVLALFFVVQQLENHIAAPLIMQKVVNLHPVTLIFSLLVLTSLFGLFGAIIAVPVAAMFKVLYNRWYYPLLHEGQEPLPSPREK